MTVTSTSNRIPYTANGTQTVFPYTFRIFTESDLRIYLDGVLQLLTIHYTISGVGVVTGGNITFLTPPAASASVVILRVLPYTQGLDLVDHDALPAETVEAAGFDRLVMLIQQLADRLGRVPTVGEFSTFLNLTIDDPVASGLLRWNAARTGIESVLLASIDPTLITLPLPIAQGGTAAATTVTARAALGVDGQTRKVLTNRAGAALVAGDVVMLDTANDSAVALDDTVSSTSQFVVALASIADTATGEFLLAGVGSVNVTGSVTRGRYLRKSATTVTAEDTGTLHGAATDPPEGSFAIALTASSAGQVTARLFGFTYPGSTAPVITGRSGVTGLSGGNNTGAPNSQFDFAATAAVVRDPVGGGTLVLVGVATRTLDVSVVGPAAGGRDEVSAFSANTWLHCYLIAKTDGTYHVTASTTSPPTGPVLPTDYTLWAYLGAIRYNNGSQIVATTLRGPHATYDAHQALQTFTTGSSGTENVASVASFVPPSAMTFELDANIQASGGSSSTDSLVLRHRTGQDGVIIWNGAAATGERVGKVVTLPQTAFFAWVLTYAGPSPLMSLDVLGYENPI